MMRSETNYKEPIGHNTQNALHHNFCDCIGFIGNAGKNRFLEHALLFVTRSRVSHASRTWAKSTQNI